MKVHTLSVMSAAAILSLGPGEANARDVEAVVYYTGFEAPAYKVGALANQDGWTVAPPESPKDAATVESDLIGSGSQAVRIDAGALGGADTEWIRPLNYTVNPSLPVVEFSWDLLLERGKLNSMAWQFSVYSVPSRAIAILWVQGDKGEVWFRTDGNSPTRTGIVVKRGTWNHLGIRVDFSHGTVEYFVNGSSAAIESATALSRPAPKFAIAEIGIRAMGPGSDRAVVDSIAIRPEESFGCRANCDHSKAEPLLNANDFQCFVNEFEKALALPVKEQISSYANFDGSRAEPVLNINDFMAFLSAYAAGCP